jgi:hypothetical protein
VAKPVAGEFEWMPDAYPDPAPLAPSTLALPVRIGTLGHASRVVVGIAPRAPGSAAYVLAHLPGERTRVRHAADGRIVTYPWITLRSWPIRTTNQRRQIRFRVLVFGEAETHPCAYCGAPLLFPESTVDHVRPLAADGADTFDNYALACPSCNVRKGCSPTWVVLFPHAPLPGPK